MPIDPFAAAAADEWSDQECLVARSLSRWPPLLSTAEPHRAPPPTPPPAVAEPTPLASAFPQEAEAMNLPARRRHRNLANGKPDKGRKTRRLHPRSHLREIPVEGDIPEVATAFISPPFQSADIMPISLWPQYTIDEQPGRFLVLSAYEKWVAAILHASRKAQRWH